MNYGLIEKMENSKLIFTKGQCLKFLDIGFSEGQLYDLCENGKIYSEKILYIYGFAESKEAFENKKNYIKAILENICGKRFLCNKTMVRNLAASYLNEIDKNNVDINIINWLLNELENEGKIQHIIVPHSKVLSRTVWYFYHIKHQPLFNELFEIVLRELDRIGYVMSINLKRIEAKLAQKYKVRFEKYWERRILDYMRYMGYASRADNAKYYTIISPEELYERITHQSI